jgi:O-antigen ligase
VIFARIAPLAVPAYLVLALVLGGSTRGIWGNMTLELLAIALLAWAVLSATRRPLSHQARPLALIVLAGLVLILLQLVPLPPALWSSFPGRDTIVEGYARLGEPLPWLPVSLAPYGTVASSLGLLPPIAVGAFVLARPQRDTWMASAVLAGACAGVVLGALQAASAGPGQSDLYFYEITNGGAVGFFANRNHFGTVLLAALPFAFALMGDESKPAKAFTGSSGLILAVVVLLLAGILLNGSTAVLLLGGPVLAFSCLLLPMAHRSKRSVGIVAIILLIVAATVLMAMPAGGGSSGDMSLLSRLEIWRVSTPLAKDVLPFGSGLGSFEQLFHLYEDTSQTTRTYVNHAHNDFLELAIELGLPGALLILAFLAWWVRQLLFAWRSPLASRFARAATIVSGAILAQSLVDYPLRIDAIASLFGLCLAWIAAPVRTGTPAGKPDPSRPRHVVIG